ncbi:response regulator transcription factor [Candidatus Altiarchaeota archaeon]
MDQAKIMIVDNEPFTLKIVSKMLEKEGYAVSTALNGVECLEKLEHEKPDILLMDIMMPEMSGWEVVKRVRDDPKLNGITILMLSAKQKEMDEGLLHLADGYIAKPFDRKTFLANIRTMLDKKGE